MKKAICMILALALCLTLGTAAFASGEGSGSGSGSMGGGSELTGVLSMAGYVAEGGGSVVTFDVYGILKPGGDGEAAYVIDRDADVNALSYTVYADRAMTEPAAGVTAAVAGNVLTVSGAAADGNTAYYIEADYDADNVGPTVIYVVNDRYPAPVTYALNDGTAIDLSEYAPGIASESRSKIYIGANTTLFSAADYGITDPAEAAIADWWLGSGVTNAGSTLTDFGDTFYRFELSVDLYRQFQIVIDQDTSAASVGGAFAEPSDVNGAMGSNDQFSDSLAANLYAGVWDGIYTVKNEAGYLENIPGVTTFDGNLPVDEEFLFVSLYNAFATPWATLNDAGRAVAAGLNAKNAGEKVAQIKAALGLEDWSAANYRTQKLAVLDVLKTADDYIAKKQGPGPELQAAVQAAGYAAADTATSDIASLIEQLSDRVIGGDTVITGEDLSTDLPTALFVKGGHVTVTDSTVMASGSNSAPGKTGRSAQELLSVEGAMPAHSTGGYNMTAANAFYREGFGACVVAWGADTVVELRTTTGEPVISAPANGSMAGGLYNAFGASYLIDGAIAYSGGQHLSNTVYNGTIHYRNALAVGAGRMYSSDFWGGNVVFENTVASGGDVTDEPTAVVVKNSVFNGTASLNGYATMYFENALIEGGNFGTQNNTSLVSDAANITLVNTRMDGASLLTVRRSSRAVLTLVDSQVNLTGSTLATLTNGSYGPGNLGADFTGMFMPEAEIRVFGTTGVNFAGDALTVSVDAGQHLRLYVKEIVGGEITNLGDGSFEIIRGDGYGTLYLNTDYALPSHAEAPASAEAAPAAADAVPATDGTENQQNMLSGTAQPATEAEYQAYEDYLRAFMTNYGGVGDGTFDDGARAMAIGELDGVGFGADVNAFPFEMYVTVFGAMDYAAFAAAAGGAAPAAAGDEKYPHFDEYRDYVAALVMADDFMASTTAYDDAYAVDNPYGIPFVDVNPVIGAMDYPDWMAANYPGVAFSAD